MKRAYENYDQIDQTVSLSPSDSITMDFLSRDDEEHMLLTAEPGVSDGDSSGITLLEHYDSSRGHKVRGEEGSHLDRESLEARGYVDVEGRTRQDQDGDSSDMNCASSDSEADSSCMTTSSSSHSSHSWEILDGPDPDTARDIDQSSTAGGGEEAGLVESVSRDAKQMLDGFKVEMRDISDGYSMIASGVDKVTTGIAEKFNKAFVAGAKSAENAVSSITKDWFENKDAGEGKGAGEEEVDSEGNRTPKKDSGKVKAGVKVTSSSGSLPRCLAQAHSQEDHRSVDNAARDNQQQQQTLRKITSVIHNSSSLLPINLRALHTEGLFSPTSEYPSSQVSTEISYCGPGEQMIIETQQNDPFDPIAVLVVYEIINVRTKESVGYLRLQAVWHCFEPAPRVGVSLGSEPAPSTEGDTVTSLDVSEGLRLRCVTKQMDAVEGDYFVQSITVTSEEVVSIAMVGRSFEKLIQKFKAF